MKDEKKNYKKSAYLNLFAAVCFGVASFSYFYRADRLYGYAFIALAIVQVILAFVNIKKSQDEDSND